MTWITPIAPALGPANAHETIRVIAVQIRVIVVQLLELRLRANLSRPGLAPARRSSESFDLGDAGEEGGV
jgi:hypothetical protein